MNTSNWKLCQLRQIVGGGFIKIPPFPIDSLYIFPTTPSECHEWSRAVRLLGPNVHVCGSRCEPNSGRACKFQSERPPALRVKPQNLLAEKLKRQPVRRRVALRRQRLPFCLPYVHYTQASRRQGHPPNLQASAKLNIAHLSWVCSKSNLKQFYNSFTWAGFALPVTMLSFTLLPISDCFDDRGRWPQCHSCIYSGFKRVGYDFTDIHLQL